MSDTFLNREGVEYRDSPWTDPAWPQFRLVDPGRAVESGRQFFASALRRLADLLEP